MNQPTEIDLAAWQSASSTLGSDLAITDATSLDLPTVRALTAYAAASERAALARTALIAGRAPAGQSEPSPAPLHIRIPGPPPAPPIGTVIVSPRGRYTGPEVSLFMSGAAMTASLVAALLAHSWAPLAAGLAAAVWLIGSVVAITTDETGKH
jgi:hypothetical protein